jgi:outer membrane protein assembly factor BamD
MIFRQRLLRAVTPRALLVAAALLAWLPLSGCEQKENMLVGEHSVSELYDSGMDAMKDEEYTNAAKLFDQVEQQHPYSVWATRAQLMAAYAYYEGLRYDDAIDALTRYIELHPGSEHVDYAYYMRALCYYEQIADVRRDQRATALSFEGFTDVVRRFPNTPYARDAAFKLDLARDHLAAKDMSIGRWYEGQGNYMAAVGRYKTVIDRYQTTTHAAEALERLTECYLALGLTEEARKTAAVLGYNYPNSDYYKQAYGLLTPGAPVVRGPDEGFFGRLWGSLFD